MARKFVAIVALKALMNWEPAEGMLFSLTLFSNAIFFFLYIQNLVLKICLLVVSFTFSRFMKKYNPCQVGTPRAVPIFQKKVVLLLSQCECFCF